MSPAVSPALPAAADIMSAPACCAEATAPFARAAMSWIGLSASLAIDLARSSMPDAPSCSDARPVDTALAPLASVAPMPPAAAVPDAPVDAVEAAAVPASASDAPAALTA
ncbi:hypothetical protein D3C72_2049070 [compost metagenome]